MKRISFIGGAWARRRVGASILLFAASLLTGCIDEYEADITADDSNLLVVEGTICSSAQNRFTLSRTQAINSTDSPRIVTGASLSVRGTDGSQYAAQAGDGCYTCQVGQLSPEVDYYLHIETDGEVYESEPQKPLRTEKIASVRGVQDTPQSSIDVLVTPEAPFAPGQANYYSWTYDETWEVRPDYKTVMYFDTDIMEPVYKDIYHFPERGWMDAAGTTVAVGASTNYADQHIEDMKIYDLGRGDERVYYRYSGLVHQRAITKAEYEYELARRQASTEMGGLFTPLPSALPTNLRCLTSQKRVIGYVGCSLNTSDYRFFLNSEELSLDRRSGGDSRLWVANPTMDDCAQMVAKGLYLCEWLTPEMSGDGRLQTAWAYIFQLDVRERYKGAYIEEPDFWSLKENVSY